MPIKEIKQTNPADLQKMLQELREKLRQLRFDLASGKVKNINDIRKTKKEIARVLTVINQK